MNRIVLFFLTLTLTLYAKTYDHIVFDGLVHLSELSATEISGLETEKELSEEDIDTAIKKLFEQGYFADIKAMDEGRTLTLYFREKPVVASIDFKGSSETEKEEKLIPLVGFKKGEIFHEEKLEAARLRIIQFMRTEGYFDTVVETDVEHHDQSVSITFEVAKGSNIIVTQQIFDGAEAFDGDDLETDLANKEEDAVSWWFGQNDGKLKLEQLEFDYHRIKNYYMKNGYLDAEISEPLMSVDFDQYAADIYYSIEEGLPYEVGTIEIKLLEGNVSLEGADEQLKLKSGKTFNIEKMRKDLQKLEDIVGSQGYAFAKVYPDIQKDKATQIANIVYAVKPGKKVYIRDVIVSGNSRTLDRVVRREVFLAPGDLYSTVEMRESKNALGRLGFFKDIKVEEKRVSENQLDIIVKVEETHTASLSVGGGYGSLNGWTVNAAISDRNVFGSAMSLSLNLEKSQLANRAEFSIFNPRVNDSSYSLGTSFYVNEVDYSTISSVNAYKSYTKGVSVRSGKRLTRYWNASASIGYSASEIYYDDDNNSIYSLYRTSGKTNKISFVPYVSFDNTDDYFTPRSGMTFTNSIEFVGFGSDQEYTGETMRFASYYGLEDWIDLDWILRYRFRGSYIYASDEAKKDYSTTSDLPYTSRLTMGGVRTVRGYRSSSISPVLLDSNGDVTFYLGGNQMIVNNFELNVPLVPQSGLRASLFYDHGMIGLDDFEEERKSYGFSFDWITPMAPLQFVFGWAIDPKPYDDTASFEFTMGQRF